MADPAGAVRNLARRDARDKLQGRTRYTVDGARPGMLHAVQVRAATASARIVRLDTSIARQMPGVRAVATASDAPGRHGIGIADHPLFAVDVIRYHGEPVAAIAADTLEQAQAAAEAVILELEPLPAALTMGEALAPGAPLLHRDWQDYEVLLEGASRGGNVAWEATVVRGDTDDAFARNDVTIVESSFLIGRQNHVSLEPRAVVATFEDGRYHIEASTQVPWTVRNVTAKVLMSRRRASVSLFRRSVEGSASSSTARSSPSQRSWPRSPDGR
jgi:CO/xanthine dehydrogenase Mo-binding subunit